MELRVQPQDGPGPPLLIYLMIPNIQCRGPKAGHQALFWSHQVSGGIGSELGFLLFLVFLRPTETVLFLLLLCWISDKFISN